MRMMKISVKDRFIEFVNKTCNRSLYPYQLPFSHRLIKSVIRNLGAELTILFARQSGKTETLCLAIAFLCIFINLLAVLIPKLKKIFDGGLLVGIFAPKAEQAQVDLRRIRNFLNDRVLSKLNLQIESDSYSKFEVYKKIDDVKQVWFSIEAISASETSNIESKTLDIIIIEEAQDVTDTKIKDEILPMGAARNATVILIGTVGNHRWYFYRACKRNEVTFPENHFDIDYRIPIKFNFRDGLYKKYVMKQMKLHGYESEFFKKKFRNIWTLELGQLFTYEKFWRCARKDLNWMNSCTVLPKQMCLAAGLDVAKDPDETVLTIGTVDFKNGIWVDEDDEDGFEPLRIVRYWESWTGINFLAQKSEIKRVLDRFPLLKSQGSIAVDATGDRGDFAPWLEDLGYDVIPVVFSTGVNTGKGELCNKFEDAVNGGFWFFAADENIIGSEHFYGKDYIHRDRTIVPHQQFEKFHKQSFDCEKEWKGNRLDLHAPKGVGYLDDYIDSAMLFNKAAKEIDFIDYNDLKVVGNDIVTADLMRDIEQIDWNKF